MGLSLQSSAAHSAGGTGSLCATKCRWCCQSQPLEKLVQESVTAPHCGVPPLQGVALAARTLGCSAVICMVGCATQGVPGGMGASSAHRARSGGACWAVPLHGGAAGSPAPALDRPLALLPGCLQPTNSPQIKIDAVKELGGTVELVGESFYEAQVHAQVRPGVLVLCSGVQTMWQSHAISQQLGFMGGRTPRASPEEAPGKGAGAVQAVVPVLGCPGRAALQARGWPLPACAQKNTPAPPTTRVQARAAAEGRVFISAYDDPFTIAGQGTIG